jgi:hypothetical protein
MVSGSRLRLVTSVGRLSKVDWQWDDLSTSNEEGSLHAAAGKPQSLAVEGITIRILTPLNHSNLDSTTMTTQIRGETLYSDSANYSL